MHDVKRDTFVRSGYYARDMATLTIRTDPDIDAALAALTAGGRSRTAAVKAAILAAAREAERADLRAWAEKVCNDPADRAEVAAVQAAMEAGRAW